jgi:hypothetical protein
VAVYMFSHYIFYESSAKEPEPSTFGARDSEKFDHVSGELWVAKD